MKRKSFLLILAMALVCQGFLSGTAAAQRWSIEQLAIWDVVEASWKASTAEDPEFTEKFLHPDFQGWSAKLAMPFNRSDLKRGLEADWPRTETKFYKLDPVKIVIHGKSAVVHHYFFWFFEVEGKPEIVSRQGRMSLFLVKEGEDWLVLGDHISDLDQE